MSSYDIFELLESVINETKVSFGEIEQAHNEYSEEISNQGLKASKKSSSETIHQANDQDLEEEENILDIAKEEIEDEEYKKIQKKPSPIKLENSTKYSSLIDNINLLRSAPSLDKIEQLKVFFNELNNNEKKCLYVLIKSLIDITVENVDGKSAYKPSMFGLIAGDISKNNVSQDNNKQEKDKNNKVDTIDTKDTSTDTPIKIGEAKQNKNDVLRVIYSNR